MIKYWKIDQENELNDALNKMGLRMTHIAKDGNCLFAAISHHLYDTPQKHLMIRRSTIDYIYQNAEEYIHLFDGKDTFYTALSAMRLSREWRDDLGDILPIAISRYLNRTIQIYTWEDVENCKLIHTQAAHEFTADDDDPIMLLQIQYKYIKDDIYEYEYHYNLLTKI